MGIIFKFRDENLKKSLELPPSKRDKTWLSQNSATPGVDGSEIRRSPVYI